MNIEKRLAVRLAQLVGARSVAHSGHSGFGGHYGGGGKWPRSLSRDGVSMGLDHHRIRRNTRRAVQENLVGRAIVERYADNVGGVGSRFAPSPAAGILGITPERAEAWGADTGAGPSARPYSRILLARVVR